jgi:hypothetical protein
MSMIFPNNFCPPNNINAPYINISLGMKALASELIQSRIIQKNLVYLIGLSSTFVQLENKLKSFEYFGQYGKIVKLVVNKNKIYNSNGPNGPSYTCFITYSNEAESSLAILCLDSIIFDNHEIKANYGTTKYCLNFLKNSECKNKECIYLHSLADKKDIVSRQQMNTDKDLFPQQRLMAIKLSEILTNKKYKELYQLKDIKTIFPNCFTVYKKDLVIRYIKEKNLGICLNLNMAELTFEKDENSFTWKNSNIIRNIDLNENMKEQNEDEKKGEPNLSSDLSALLNNLIQKNKFNSNYLYKTTSKSRFSFANSNEISIGRVIPSEINDILTHMCSKLSKYSQREYNNICDEYFKYRYLDSDSSWSSLISIYNKWNNADKEDFDLKKKSRT